jgi:excisionase family DNA binding protein
MTTNGGEWLTVQEAAKLSGYHPETLRELIRQGKIKARKFSIVYQVNKESLLAYTTKAQAMGEKRGRKPEK